MRRWPATEMTRTATERARRWRRRRAAAVVVVAMVAGLPATAHAAPFTVHITSGTGQVKGPSGQLCVRDDATAAATLCTFDVAEASDVSLETVLDEFRAVRWDDPASCGAEELCTILAGGANRQATVAFEPGPANLTIVANLLGGVTLDPSGTPRGGTPSGSACAAPPAEPSVCSYDYPRGTTVTLTPAPDAAAGAFVGWSAVECPGMLACTLTLDSGMTSATVTYSNVRLSIQSSSAVVVSGAAIGTDLNCSGQCFADVPYGVGQTLTARPEPPSDAAIYWFRGCEEGADHVGPTCTVAPTLNPWWVTVGLASDTIGAPPLVQATFKVYKRGQGTVRAGKLDCGRTCSNTYDFGTKVSLVADPDAGWAFERWEGGCGSDPSCRLTVGPTTSVRAIFTPRAGAASAAPTKGASSDPTPAPNPPSPRVPPRKATPLLSHLSVRASGRGRGRRIVVAFDLARRSKVAVGLARGHRRVASRSRVLPAGHRRLQLTIPRRLRAGAYRVTVSAVAGRDRVTMARVVRLRR